MEALVGGAHARGDPRTALEASVLLKGKVATADRVRRRAGTYRDARQHPVTPCTFGSSRGQPQKVPDLRRSRRRPRPRDGGVWRRSVSSWSRIGRRGASAASQSAREGSLNVTLEGADPAPALRVLEIQSFVQQTMRLTPKYACDKENRLRLVAGGPMASRENARNCAGAPATGRRRRALAAVRW